nr:SH3-like domain-containing protein [Roseomonas gilardii]
MRFDWPESRGPAHIRTPHYLRGREGVVLTHLGDFPDPSELAFGRPAPLRPLYHVAFAQAALSGAAGEGDRPWSSSTGTGWSRWARKGGYPDGRTAARRLCRPAGPLPGGAGGEGRHQRRRA